VGAHGVKLDAAPDAPSWGQVLACSPPVLVRIQRRAVAATDTHPSPHRYTRQAQTVYDGAGCEAVRASPAFWACRDSSLPVLTPMSVPASATAGQARTADRAWWPARRRTVGMRGSAGMADSTTTGPADRPERDSGWQRPSLRPHPRPGKDPS